MTDLMQVRVGIERIRLLTKLVVVDIGVFRITGNLVHSQTGDFGLREDVTSVELLELLCKIVTHILDISVCSLIDDLQDGC